MCHWKMGLGRYLMIYMQDLAQAHIVAYENPEAEEITCMAQYMNMGSG